MRKLLTLVVFCSLIATAAVARAQQTLGALNGTVVDASGAAVPGSTVTVTDAEIGVTRTAKASDSGFYQIFNLPVGTYKVKATHDGFDTTEVGSISVREAGATTVNLALKVGQITTSVEVTANPLLNESDATNGYTLDSEQIALTPLGTGSFTQLAVLSPGVSAELLSGLDSNAGLGNQPIWANGQRDTSNTFQVNGVDVSNLFNGKTSSSANSQRYNFNTGNGGTVAGEVQTGTSVFSSNGNSLPSPSPEFLQELRVNASSYDAQQGATSGAQIDANTRSGTNSIHGQMYGTYADNSLNAAPFFFKQDAALATQGIGAFPQRLANPQLHRWTTGATLGGPVLKDKLFYFLGYEHLYASDEAGGLSQLNVPSGLTDDRSVTGIEAAAQSWANGTAYTGAISQTALDLLQSKLPNGQYLIPSTQLPTSTAYAYGVPNVTLGGVAVLAGDKGVGALDYDLTRNDRVSVKYYYQNDPDTKPYGVSDIGGFPATQANTSHVFALDNTIAIGSRLNWEQRLGFSRMGSYSYYNQTVTDTADPSAGGSFGINSAYLDPGVLPGLYLERFGAKANAGVPTLTGGPDTAFIDTGFHQNRLNPSTNVIFSLGKHTLVAGFGYNYTQLNIANNRTGHGQVAAQNFETFLAGTAYTSGNRTAVLNTVDDGQNLADRYYRSNELDGYLQDKWQAEPNLSITAGVRYDYHGGLTEKYGNLYNFNGNNYDVEGTDTTGFTVLDAGFQVAPNNKNLSGVATQDVAATNSTLSGRQWGISPRIGFAWTPKFTANKLVVSGGTGIYYDRGELFSYLSQPAGSATGGPFGVTESAPEASYITASGKHNTFSNPFATANVPPLSPNPAVINTALQQQLDAMTSQSGGNGYNCGGVGQEEDDACPSPLNFGGYNKNNKLPYTINYTLTLQWQPRNDLAVSLGYVGNRGRHAIIPLPINLPEIASPSNPGTIGGKDPHPSGEINSYGFEVLNTSSQSNGYDYDPITTEPWSTYDGGNTDFRAPYVGLNPQAALFTAAGNSAFDALEAHVEKRLSHHVQAGVSYTWSHALDEQSDIGLFFTGNNPANLRQSYGSSDFDRTHILTANFLLTLPNAAKEHSALSYLTNDWALTGIGVFQSGEPYSLYEFYGASGSVNVGNYPSLQNPVLGIKDPSHPKSALTGNKGAFRGPGGSYIPKIDPSQIAINYLAPGQKGVPTLAEDPNQSDPVDIYETDYAPGNQRNIFRQDYQKRLDLSFRKTFKVNERIAVQYAFNVFNVFNSTSFDVPQDQTQIRQTGYTCSTYELENDPYGDCALGYTYGQVGTSNLPADQQSALQHLDQKPVYNGSGKTTTIPTSLSVGQATCLASGSYNGTQCPNNGANFGSVTGTIGGNRAITMGLHIVY